MQDLGVFNFMGWSMVGGHVTHNYTDCWLLKRRFTARPAMRRPRHPAYAVFVAEARLQGHVDE